MMEVEEDTRSSRKRRRVFTRKSRKSRRIVFKSCHNLRSPVRLNDCVDIFSLLFPNPNDFLITNDCRQVRESELSGKTILLYMEPLTGFDLLEYETFHLIETYNELWPKGGFEVVFVPVNQGDDHDYTEERFYDLFSHMPWPAVPFSNKLACDRIEHLSNKLACESNDYPCSLPCPWVILSPRGKVMLKHERDNFYGRFFNYHGGADCPLSRQELLRLEYEDRATLQAGSVINLNQLLATPSRGFVLTKHGNKVPISSLEDKVVGLYLCDVPSPRRMELIKKVYQEALDLRYNFEIVQINFHFPCWCKDQKIDINDLPMEPGCENIPWLTVPFKDSCCRRLRRIFQTYKGDWSDWGGERLVIINPHEPNISGIFFDTRGAEIIEHFGIEAYPFTRRRVVELERKRRRQELKLEQNLGPLLLRGRGGDDCGFDRVPVSQLWGKNVLVVLAGHSLYKSCEYLPILKAKYLEQERFDDDKPKFEVVYVSTDPDGSSFEECTKSMPWLVHPYSLEVADLCMSNLFSSHLRHKEYSIQFNPRLEAVSYLAHAFRDMFELYYPHLNRPCIVDPTIVAAAFSVDGELLSKCPYYTCDVKQYPFMPIYRRDLEFLYDLRSIIDIGEIFSNELSY